MPSLEGYQKRYGSFREGSPQDSGLSKLAGRPKGYVSLSRACSMSDAPAPLANVGPALPDLEAPLEGRGFQPPSTSDPKTERESKTARILAIALIVMLGITFLANIATLTVLTIFNRLDAGPQFERMFAVWLPLLSGLVGSAVTFYLTKDPR